MSTDNPIGVFAGVNALQATNQIVLFHNKMEEACLDVAEILLEVSEGGSRRLGIRVDFFLSFVFERHYRIS